MITIESLQGGSELPKDALLNTTDDLNALDALDNFIEKMINCRIPQDAKTTQNLIAAIHREIHNLLFNVEVDKSMIYESVTAIQKNFTESSSPRKKSNKKSDKISLPHYATYEFIFNVILSYIQEQKAIIKPSFEHMLPHEEEKNISLQSSNISAQSSNMSLQSSI